MSKALLRAWRWQGRVLTGSGFEWGLLIGLPALAIGMMWWIFSSAQVQGLAVGVMDEDGSSLSRELVRMVDATVAVDVVGFVDKDKAEGALRRGEVFGVVWIARGFERQVMRVEGGVVSLWVNAQYGTHSGVVQAAVSSAVRALSAGMEGRLRLALGASGAVMPLLPVADMAFNPELSYQKFLASGVIVALLHILATVMGVGAVGLELRHRTLGRWFVWVAQGREGFWLGIWALMGKLTWQMLALAVWALVAVMLMAQGAGVSLQALVMVVLCLWALLGLSLWLGVVLALGTLSMRMGLSNAGILTAPAFAFSGITYPLAAMPWGAKMVAMGLPLTHYLKVQVALLQAGAPPMVAFKPLIGLSVAGVGLMLLAGGLLQRALRLRLRWGRR